ncbi:UNVERIFIED_ORG: hypothetical protein ABIB21_003049 [Arthrobacter sp. UYEF13]
MLDSREGLAKVLTKLLVCERFAEPRDGLKLLALEHCGDFVDLGEAARRRPSDNLG